MGSNVKKEKRSTAPAKIEEGSDSPSQLRSKWRDLVNLLVSPVDDSEAALKERTQEVENYRTEVRELLVAIAEERAPQQPTKFGNLEATQTELVETLKSKEGKKFEDQVNGVLAQHVAYERHLHASYEEVLNLLEDLAANLVSEERKLKVQEVEALKRLVEKQNSDLEATRINLEETTQSLEDINKTYKESSKSDKETIQKLKKEIISFAEVKEQLIEEIGKLERYKELYHAQKEGNSANLRAYDNERENLIGEVEQATKELNEHRAQTKTLTLENELLKKTNIELIKRKEESERLLLAARRDLEKAVAFPAGNLDASVGSEDYGRPTETPRVTFSRRLSLGLEMATRGQNTTFETTGRFISTPGTQTPGKSDDSSESQGQSVFLRHLGELVTREDRKNIPIFKGDGELFAADWLREAERIARSNEWDDSQKIKFFADRLRGEAYEWHCEYLEENPGNIVYRDWKKELLTRFTDEADRERLRTKLNSLKQRPDQRVKAFIARINQLYDAVHGKEPTSSRADLGHTAQEYLNEIRKYRSEAKRKILLAGLLPKIKEELWPRLPKDADYDKISECATMAESVVVSKELAETHDGDKLNAVLSGIQDREKEHADEIDNLKKQIEELTRKLSQETTVNAIGNAPPSRGRGRGRGFLRGRGRGFRGRTSFNRFNRGAYTQSNFNNQQPGNAPTQTTQCAPSPRYLVARKLQDVS